MTTPRKIRCAIYTRKSSDDGLDQAFNSLDAQREACAAYIASQRHEGWKLLATRYDDGGLSGGTLERPALQRLLADIDAGRIDMVVVYKIDRLTRSLADFARLVERFEQASCSFVSVTQSFNTSSSMGRLTLNVLLSFAQFEREVTAERIRDKIAASKKKGLWMGGTVPLGYDRHPDPNTRELVVNADEARTVRRLFTLYAEHGCLRRVTEAAAREGLRSKRRVRADGTLTGGRPLSRGQIHYLLCNPVYRGQIRHREKVWPGLHEPIIEEGLWTEVQEKLQAAARRPRGSKEEIPGRSQSTQAVLTGKLRDETGDRLTPTHTSRHGRRLRYYISNRLVSGGPDPSGWRLPAPALERAIRDVLCDHLEEAAASHRVLASPDASQDAAVAKAVANFVGRLRTDAGPAWADLIAEGRLARNRVAIDLDANKLAEALGLTAEDLAPTLCHITAPLRLRRRGVETKIIAGEPAPAPDPHLRAMLIRAHGWARALRAGRPLSEIATAEGVSESFLRTRAQLAFLAPKIQAAILEGTQPPELTLKRLTERALPLDWAAQERLFGV
ncbi:DNA invertase Pin-like site-specific DNA recombinase [Albidovulum inexpectatum]|uniref:DNA invertase Pin-like site-specific DNA recombinase n=1 Tax=Albidovulum inexpectatum TaxID=196587 RepID=A0A2S5JJ00_9RHOB|nr:recombinase family protein [Albidovulum inexpectatum]PPB81348.1 DNA invertase Pin-like site-specific DNA recombinase [Albidovulum inexpectatum]